MCASTQRDSGVFFFQQRFHKVIKPVDCNLNHKRFTILGLRSKLANLACIRTVIKPSV